MFKARLLLVLFVTFCAGLAHAGWQSQTAVIRVLGIMLGLPMLSACIVLVMTFLKARIREDGAVVLNKDTWLYRIFTLNGALTPESLCGYTWGGAGLLAVGGVVVGFLASIIAILVGVFTTGPVQGSATILGVAVVALFCQMVVKQKSWEGVLVAVLGVAVFVMATATTALQQHVAWWLAGPEIIGIALGIMLGLSLVIACAFGIAKFLEIPAVKAFKQRLCPLVTTS